ncbi:thiamine ABC transporter substrate-binding protein [Streptomyces sp. H10-C2]|uniref:thiamine ABC transporter substrate-binding protein n=1 Tax=unclassified Streptomyces TaxID=2593676 RepID=UPI0024B89F26|nr:MULTISPECIES: thiamine ABC transporter substrate-binding protein [unclassified Streptomyces]MDJ0343335.1 thiamine ABC transporter substrate-binding protein [Streptomyces sp. PH10-H1]MDJ0372880.1 thiamine ABC transporter substrate-binding protein [Streptomyces sp. H10-C2]
MNTNLRCAAIAVVATALGATALTACGGSADKAADSTRTASKTVTLVSHDSFAASAPVLKEFTKETGYTVKVLRGGDAGAAVNQAILSKGHPQGDVFFGVDNTLLSRALDNDLFTPYEAKGLDQVPAALQLDKDKHRVTPIDSGDVCVNYDRKYFDAHKLAVPASFDDLIKPEYKNLLVTENAATSSPGLAFQLGTIAKYGDDGWQGYWKKLKENGVEVVDGWEQAYNDRFSGSGGGKGKGDKPLVVSYASSPPAEVLGVKPQPAQGPTGVAAGTCFRQIEFAGLLKGGANDKGGKALLDFLLSKRFQEDMPLQMFVNPARTDAALPAEFTKYGAKIETPPALAPDRIAKNRDQWVKTWSSLVLK